MVEVLPDVLKAQFIAGLRETLYRVIFMLRTHKLNMNFSNTNPSFLFIIRHVSPSLTSFSVHVVGADFVSRSLHFILSSGHSREFWSPLSFLFMVSKSGQNKTLSLT